ncbi:hypothetical protein RHAL1_02816 [Beijerinckiaceae bacterium RH AL1]|nr:DUF805 domain-containing protein [Beijerinckiaceae bacterium]VVB47446.1 hypothetical protein RHCH11_RHCH11_02756 [Beijerinckiaceae bacterium RH CH11]VVB47528.1 hypothetical protein RHAL8_02752 [Beijerinckiaceae bacterium RH AL8]VVC55893.1 hypothetical protein RHAL1_02816 [Beijerinckiaceae bacterium RH AL1]
MSDASHAWPAAIDFEGRVARLPFAVIALGIGAVMPLMIDLAVLCARDLGAALPSRVIPALLQWVPASLALPLLIVDGIALVALAVILLSFEVRRLHDMNVTGWLVLARLAFPALPLPDVDPFPSIAFLIWWLLLATIPGTAGPNAYGPE